MVLHLSEGSDNKPNILKKNILLKDSREFLVQIQTEDSSICACAVFKDAVVGNITLRGIPTTRVTSILPDLF